MKSGIALIKLLLAVNAMLVLQACVINAPAKPNDPYYAPVIQPTEALQRPTNGSLYSESLAVGLFSDRKAVRVGDIITVLLQERTQSSKSSNIGLVKDNDINVDSSSTILGMQPSLGEIGLGTDLVSEREFTGEADADQSNQLAGTITVTVVDKLPNGTLVIRGEKWMTLNRGDEYIRISGLVRPDDVTRDNMVASTKIANARITYSGTGELADSQKMGWIGRFFNSPIWPF